MDNRISDPAHVVTRGDPSCDPDLYPFVLMARQREASIVRRQASAAWNREQVRQLASQEVADKEIARRLGLHIKTVRRMKK